MNLIASLIPGQATITSWDGSAIPGVISGLTAHTWVADTNGLFHTATDLTTEWANDYQMMLAGHGGQLTALQRMEGNAEAVVENTHAATFGAAKQNQLREDLQREYDTIDAAMRIDQQQYGIDPAKQFNATTYLKMEQALQGNDTLLELAYQGHGTNDPIASRYSGYTTDFQHKTDGVTYFVGGGIDNGEKAIAAFLDDVVLTHAPFASVMHNGTMTQLNQNGDFESSVADAVAGIDESAFTRVFVASDFSANPAAHGAVVLVPDAQAAPALPVVAAGQVTTLDGSIIAGTIAGLTAHTWIADSTGLFHTGNLAAEWKADLKLMQSGASLTVLQRWEANAEVVLENTGLAKLPAAKQQAFREDAQREFDAVWSAMQIDQAKLGIADTADFTSHSYLMMEHTLSGNETLSELATQGHGLNGQVASKYRGYTQDFQHHVDSKTLYVGGGLDNNEKAIAAFFDDAVLSHAAFPTLLHNGQLVQLNQNGNREDSLTTVVAAANQTIFHRALTAADFSKAA